MFHLQSFDSSFIIDMERNKICSLVSAKPGRMDSVLILRVSIILLDNVAIGTVRLDLDSRHRNSLNKRLKCLEVVTFS